MTLKGSHALSSSLLPLVLRVLQHLLLPQVKEVGWVRVELHPIGVVISVSKERLVSYWSQLEVNARLVVVSVQCTCKQREC